MASREHQLGNAAGSSRIDTDRRHLDRVGAAVGPLLERTGAPVTAQWWWVREWFDAHPRWEPFIVTVGHPSQPEAAAVLARRRRGPIVEVVPAGFGQSDYPWLPVEEGAADALAAAVAEALASCRPGWRLTVNELPRHDPAALALAKLLPNQITYDGVGAPVVDLASFDPRRTIPSDARKTVRRSRNRLVADGRDVQFEVRRGSAEIEPVLPDVFSTHVARDRAVRGSSDLDVPEQRAFWFAVLRAAAARDQVEIVVMRVDGRHAAHLVGLLDGRSYRVWDSRFLPEFGRYAPGHLLRDEVLGRIADSGEFDVFDWMRGVEPYKLQSATRVVETLRLRAWSHRALRAVESLARTTRRSRATEEPQ